MRTSATTARSWASPYVEGFGLGYNADILEKAGIDPATLTTYSAVKAALETLDAQKADLGLDAVVSMAASIAGGMWWTMGSHNFNAYLAGGLAYDDTSILDKLLPGRSGCRPHGGLRRLRQAAV